MQLKEPPFVSVPFCSLYPLAREIGFFVVLLMYVLSTTAGALLECFQQSISVPIFSIFPYFPIPYLSSVLGALSLELRPFQASESR